MLHINVFVICKYFVPTLSGVTEQLLEQFSKRPLLTSTMFLIVSWQAWHSVNSPVMNKGIGLFHSSYGQQSL